MTSLVGKRRSTPWRSCRGVCWGLGFYLLPSASYCFRLPFASSCFPHSSLLLRFVSFSSFDLILLFWLPPFAFLRFLLLPSASCCFLLPVASFCFLCLHPFGFLCLLLLMVLHSTSFCFLLFPFARCWLLLLAVDVFLGFLTSPPLLFSSCLPAFLDVVSFCFLLLPSAPVCFLELPSARVFLSASVCFLLHRGPRAHDLIDDHAAGDSVFRLRLLPSASLCFLLLLVLCFLAYCAHRVHDFVGDIGENWLGGRCEQRRTSLPFALFVLLPLPWRASFLRQDCQHFRSQLEATTGTTASDVAAVRLACVEGDFHEDAAGHILLRNPRVAFAQTKIWRDYVNVKAEVDEASRLMAMDTALSEAESSLVQINFDRDALMIQKDVAAYLAATANQEQFKNKE